MRDDVNQWLGDDEGEGLRSWGNLLHSFYAKIDKNTAFHLYGLAIKGRTIRE
jgi:hypothetical protein